MLRHSTFAFAFSWVLPTTRFRIRSRCARGNLVSSGTAMALQVFTEYGSLQETLEKIRSEKNIKIADATIAAILKNVCRTPRCAPMAVSRAVSEVMANLPVRCPVKWLSQPTTGQYVAHEWSRKRPSWPRIPGQIEMRVHRLATLPPIRQTGVLRRGHFLFWPLDTCQWKTVKADAAVGRMQRQQHRIRHFCT